MIELGHRIEVSHSSCKCKRVKLLMKKDERAYMVSTLPWEILLAFSIPYC